MTPRIVDVTVEPDSIPGLTGDLDGFHVNPVWAFPGIKLDRPETGGWFVTTRALADRLKQALLDGAVYTDAHLTADVNGNTYIAATQLVLGKKLNADLKRLGY